MKIASIETLAAYAGWRIHDFVKITLEDGLVGWSEFSRALNGPGIGEAVVAIAASLIGLDPRSSQVRTLLLEAGRASNIAYQACGALSNGLLDVRARGLGVPVYELLGGRVRDRVRVYWAHCGTYRASHAELMGKPPLRTLDDLVHIGHEVVDAGFSAFKTNLLLFNDGRATRYAPRRANDAPALTAPSGLVRAVQAQLEALREGSGFDVDMMVDLGSNFRTEAALTMTRAMESYGPAWVEMELRDPSGLRYIREHTRTPIAGGERLRAAEFHAFLSQGAVDVAIVDVLFNGLAASLQVAAAAEAYECNVAVHNCYSPLATLMAATYCAVVPNLHSLEMDVDGVPWQGEFVTVAPAVEHGWLTLTSGPGWGAEVNEAAVRAHPVPAR